MNDEQLKYMKPFSYFSKPLFFLLNDNLRTDLKCSAVPYQPSSPDFSYQKVPENFFDLENNVQ